MIRALAVLALAALGCAQSPEAPSAPDSAVDQITASSRAAAMSAQAFDPGAAVPDSGALALVGRVSRFDNMGTCQNPIPDSSSAGPVWARVHWARRLHYPDGTVTEQTHADSFEVQRGGPFSYWARVECDTYKVNVRTYKGRVGSDCRVWLESVIVTPSAPPSIELVRP